MNKIEGASSECEVALREVPTEASKFHGVSPKDKVLLEIKGREAVYFNMLSSAYYG